MHYQRAKGVTKDSELLLSRGSFLSANSRYRQIKANTNRATADPSAVVCVLVCVPLTSFTTCRVLFGPDVRGEATRVTAAVKSK